MKKCKQCGLEKQWTRAGVSNTGQYKYVDSDEMPWHGRTCYDCFKLRIKTKYTPVEAKEHTCGECGDGYATKVAHRRFCSDKCRNKNNYKQARALA